MRRSMFASLGGLVLAVFAVPAQGSIPAHPGTLNYIEGTASIGSQALNSQSVGSVELSAGQTISTKNGKAEILLTPGIFFRLGDDSSATMVSPGLTNTLLTLEKGRAMVEVDEIRPENNVRVNEHGVSTRLLKTGLYDFDADRGAIRVFDGQASVETPGHPVKLKGGHELDLNATGNLKAQKFDKKASQDDFYRWSSLRSAYVAEANVDSARLYVAGPGVYGPEWFGAGWYWDPYFGAYTFIPADGIFYSPFGFGYYSPWYVGAVPYYGFGFNHRFGPGYRYPARGFSSGAIGHRNSFVGSAPAPRFSGGGFRGGAGGFRGGGGRR